MRANDDDTIEGLAAGQLGLVTRTQLLELGIASDTIDRRVSAKRLRLMHRGVYRVGPLVAPHARELAAVLACAPHAFLSHTSVAPLWQLLPDAPDGTVVEVSITQGDRGRRPNIRVHRVRLQPADVTTLQNIPVTSAARTVTDLAAVLQERDLERVLAQAERLNLLDRSTLHSLAEQRFGRPGAPLLRAMLACEAGPALTRSEAEQRFLTLIRKAQLPLPETNVRVGGYEVDFFWRRHGLVVEVDGYAFHSSRRRFENDRRRDALLTANGVNVMRVTWRQVVHESVAMLARVAQALGRTGVVALPESRTAIRP